MKKPEQLQLDFSRQSTQSPAAALACAVVLDFSQAKQSREERELAAIYDSIRESVKHVSWGRPVRHFD